MIWSSITDHMWLCSSLFCGLLRFCSLCFCDTMWHTAHNAHDDKPKWCPEACLYMFGVMGKWVVSSEKESLSGEKCNTCVRWEVRKTCVVRSEKNVWWLTCKGCNEMQDIHQCCIWFEAASLITCDFAHRYFVGYSDFPHSVLWHDVTHCSQCSR